ncbi:hypothetical protein FAVG1_00515 [Fusarium avenaceum]|nr:hypothetical protein FAVG1_00515 [Fusarium avenaceum]
MPERPKPLLAVKEFQSQIDEAKDPSQRVLRHHSVESVLAWFEELRPMMSKEAVSATTAYLQSTKWVKNPATPAAHEHYKRAKGNANRHRNILYFPDLIIILATYKGNKTVDKLVDDYSEHWGFQFSKIEPSYPLDLDLEQEMRLFEGLSKSGGSVDASPPHIVPGTITSGSKRNAELDPWLGITSPTPKKQKPVSGLATKSLLESQSSSVASSESAAEVGQESNHPSSLGVPRLGRFTHDNNKTFTSHEQSQHGMFKGSNRYAHTPRKPQFQSPPDLSDPPSGLQSNSSYLRAKPLDPQSKSSDLLVMPPGNQSLASGDESDCELTAVEAATSSTLPQHDLDCSQLQTSKRVKGANFFSGPVTGQSSRNYQTRAYGYKEPSKRNGHETASDAGLIQFSKGLKDKALLPEQGVSALSERAQQKPRNAQRLGNEDKEPHGTETTYYRELTKIQTNRINQLETEVESLKKENVSLRETQQCRTATQEAETQTESMSSDFFPTKQLIDVVDATMTRGMAKVTENIKTAVMDFLDEANS